MTVGDGCVADCFDVVAAGMPVGQDRGDFSDECGGAEICVAGVFEVHAAGRCGSGLSLIGGAADWIGLPQGWDVSIELYDMSNDIATQHPELVEVFFKA